jgi:ribonuclease BN (tRNA processing enzyme)
LPQAALLGKAAYIEGQFSGDRDRQRMQKRHQARGTLTGVPSRLRVTIWGARGSCEQFPAPKEVAEFMRQIAISTLSRMSEDMLQKAKDGRCSLTELIEGELSHDTLEAYQKKIGLPELPVYGGETTCIEVETSDGDILIFDGGSGIRHCALRLVERWKNRTDKTVHIFGSHEHLDHRSGLPFSRFCFVKDNPFNLKIYGTYQYLMALDSRFAIFSRQITETTHMDDPLDYRLMSATFAASEFRDFKHTEGIDVCRTPPWSIRDVGLPMKIGNTQITAFFAYHGQTRCLSYRVDHGGSSFVFCTDHELRLGDDPNDPRQKASVEAEKRVRAHCMGADLVYFDGQYFRDEYHGRVGIGTSPPILRRDWGHSCVEDVLDRVRECGIKHCLIGHHDPDREWTDQMKMDAYLATECDGQDFHVELARGDSEYDLV